MRGYGRGIAAVTLTIAAAGCGDRRPPAAETVSVDTIEGVETITSLAARSPETQWTVGEPRLTLGRLEGESPEVFGSIGGVAVGPGGRIFVGDTQAKEVRAFGADGSFLFRFGREGEGPGEFENIDALLITEDGELLVRDVDQGRVSVFDLDGAFLRDFRLERPFLQWQTRPTLWVDTAGRIYDWLQISLGTRDTMGVAVYERDGTPIGRVATDAFDRQMIRIFRGDRALAGIPVPMTPYAVGAVDRRGRIISGVGDAYELEVRNADGELRRRIRRRVDPSPVPPWLADTVRTRIADFVDDLGGGTPEDYELPETRPAFTLLLTDDLGYLWVARDGDQAKLPTRYDVFDPDDRYLVSLTLPPLRLMQIGRDFIAGITYDELGVERAVLLPLTRG